MSCNHDREYWEFYDEEYDRVIYQCTKCLELNIEHKTDDYDTYIDNKANEEFNAITGL